jgi:hypothetical protein
MGTSHFGSARLILHRLPILDRWPDDAKMVSQYKTVAERKVRRARERSEALVALANASPRSLDRAAGGTFCSARRQRAALATTAMWTSSSIFR